jgi:hypothetical protein
LTAGAGQSGKAATDASGVAGDETVGMASVAILTGAEAAGAKARPADAKIAAEPTKLKARPRMILAPQIRHG